MGEIAEMMLDGELCEQCGVYMGGASGFVRICGGCRQDSQQPAPYMKVRCRKCGKLVKQAGLADHTKALHPVKGSGHG